MILHFYSDREFENFIELSNLRSTTKLAEAFILSELEMQFDEIQYSRFQRPKVMQYKGRRWSVADSYYFKSNSSMQHIMVNAKVDRIIFDNDAIESTTTTTSTPIGTKSSSTASADTTMKAVGVIYRKYGRNFEVRATKAVILSSGTIGTPAILLKSGIGPENLYSTKNKTKKERKRMQKNLLKIELRKHLPAVGEYLQDHVTTGMDLIQLENTIGLEPWYLYSVENLINYFWSGSGPLTMSGCEGLGFIRTKNAYHLNSTDNGPDLGFMVIPMGATVDAGVYFRRILNINDHTWQEYFQPLVGTPTISILPIVLHPKSRGYVSIRLSKENEIETIIQPEYLSHPDDIDVLVTGLKIITKLVNTPLFRAIGAYITERNLPGCMHYEFGSDEYWQCYVQHLTLTAYHPVGTCRMGQDPNNSVVNSTTFQVHGIENLYICDASVMPSMPSANPQAAVGMLAKKFLRSFKENYPNE